MKHLGQLIFAVIVFGALFGDVNWSPACDVANRVVGIVEPDESGTKMEWMG